MFRKLAPLGAALGLLLSASNLWAEDIPVPSQAGWAGAKKTVNLPNGITMAYSEMGDSEGDPLVLIHGYSDNSRSWSLLAPYLTERHIYAIDLRGHGKSSAPECCYAYTDLAYDVHLFLEALDIGKADIVGHSLGSLTTQLLSAQHPEQVKKAVLLSSTVETGSGPGSWLWDNIMPLQPPIDPNGQFMMDWYWNPNPVDQDFISAERTESAAMPIHVWRGVLWGTALGSLSAFTGLVEAPMLIVWGDQDQLFDAAHQENLKQAYPNARFETFEGAGHNMFWEMPEQAAAAISDFLDG